MHSLDKFDARENTTFTKTIDVEESCPGVGMAGVSSVVIAPCNKSTTLCTMASPSPLFRLNGVKVGNKAPKTITSLLALNPTPCETKETAPSFPSNNFKFSEETPETNNAPLECNAPRAKICPTSVSHSLCSTVSDTYSDQTTEPTSEDEQDEQTEYYLALREARAQLLVKFRQHLRLLRKQRSVNHSLIQKRNECRRRLVGKHNKNNLPHAPNTCPIPDPGKSYHGPDGWRAEGICGSPLSIEEENEVAVATTVVGPTNSVVLSKDVVMPAATDEDIPYSSSIESSYPSSM